MCYFGINKGIQRLADNGIVSRLHQTDVVQLQFNVDGIPLFKSSNMQLWPILCFVKLSGVHKPFVVAAFCGTKKPADINDFLFDFVNELKQLQQIGLMKNGNLHDVLIHSFVCDAPARAFLKTSNCTPVIVAANVVPRKVNGLGGLSFLRLTVHCGLQSNLWKWLMIIIIWVQHR